MNECEETEKRNTGMIIEKTKALAYAYASSTDASALKHAETGCYYIEINETHRHSDGSVDRKPPRIWPGTEHLASPEARGVKFQALLARYRELEVESDRGCLTQFGAGRG